MDYTYGRNRESIANIESMLDSIFAEHPEATENEDGELLIPATHLPDVFKSLSESGLELLSKEEEESLKKLLSENPGMSVSSRLLIGFLAAKTKAATPPESTQNSSPEVSDGEDPLRGRSQDRHNQSRGGRSSSGSSVGTSRNFSRPPSRSGAPQTPRNSAFDTSRRQRATPLESAAPSSWSARPKAPHRRKSMDAGNKSDRDRSDGEITSPPSSYARGSSKTRRSRAPSNPTSPSPNAVGGLMSSPEPVYSPGHSPTFTPSRPRSRSHSQPFSLDADRSGGYSSPDEDYVSSQISSLPMPRSSSPTFEDDDEDEFSLSLVHERESTSSTASMEPMDRVEALTRANAEWQRKLREAEQTLQNKLSEHEYELEELQSKLEELRSELSATKREEKELRGKERANITQINSLESEVSKLTKAIEQARLTYQSLQKQYQEQCAVAERYRSDLRNRDETIRSLRDQIGLAEIEQQKWQNVQHAYEEKIGQLEDELVRAQETYSELDEQKNENLMLKETIDRMRFDMDELRNSLASGIHTTSGGASSGTTSRSNTVSKSLGAEILAKLAKQGEDGDVEDEDGEGDVEEDDGSGTDGGNETVVEEVEEGLGSGSEGEDIVQTYIRKVIKKKGTSKSKTVSRTVEETKVYADCSVQYDPTPFLSTSQTQTDPSPPPPVPPAKLDLGVQMTPPASPVRHSIEIETDPIPEPPKVFRDTVVGTDPMELGVKVVEVEKLVEVEKVVERLVEVEKEVERAKEKEIPRVLLDMQVQTEELKEEEEEEEEEDPATMASSSSTIRPPTPKANLLSLPQPQDAPPAYEPGEDEEEREWRLAAETLKKWHHGMKIPFEAAPGGVSDDALEEWKALKEELGVECEVIERVLKKSDKTGLPRGTDAASTSGSTEDDATANGKGKRRTSRLYNIYNTYVYKNRGSDGSGPSFLTQTVTHTILVAGLSTLIGMAIAPHMSPQFHIPGGATVYDRNAWASFNGLQAAGEGFGGGYGYGQADGAGAVWNFLGRVGGGAARIARGWPT